MSATQTPSIESSRRALLDAIGATRDLTFVRGEGKRGDELIWAGTRALLAGRIRREISIEELGASGGELAVIAGSGALCRTYCEWKPHAIAVAELRFERVIVLPSSVEVGEDRVREALSRSTAIVFAREPESLRAIAGLCEARLAHDTAFFFDYGPWAGEAGSGCLNAFRLDRERRSELGVPPDNDDITTTSPSLEAWLARIAAAAHVRTDRAHVMIAAALLGKTVEYAPSNYHKLPAIAEWALAELSVHAIAPSGGAPEPRLPPSPRRRRLRPLKRSAGAEICAVIATRDRPDCAAAAVASVLETDGASAVVVDSNSAPSRRLRPAGESDDRVRVRTLDRDLGRAGSRMTGVRLAAAEFVLLLDDDLVLQREALPRMAATLRTEPDLAALTATVTGADGALEHRGGTHTREGDLVRLRRTNGAPEAASRASLKPCDWTPHSALLIRAGALDLIPLAVDVRGFEDEEWGLRARESSLRVACAPDALATRFHSATRAYGVPFAERMRALELALSLARIHDRHGLVLEQVFDVLPQLGGDLDGARILFARLLARGPHAVLAAWDAGELAPLLESAQ